MATQPTNSVPSVERERIRQLADKAIRKAQEVAPNMYPDALKLQAICTMLDFHKHYPMDLDLMEQVEDFHLLHDVFGLINHWDIEEHSMTECFWPRCMPRVKG